MLKEWLNVTEYNWTYWLAGLFALLGLIKESANMFDWLFNKLGIETKRMREKRKMTKRLEKVEESIVKIEDTSKKNVQMFLDHEKQVVEKFTGIKDEIIMELNKIHDKIDEQKKEMDEKNEANIKTDCAMLRDRIAGGMRYFSQKKDEEGKVHISFSDYENMEALFQEYFSKGGNGAFRKIYEDEFKKFEIER